MKSPNFIIAGERRSGTSTLSKWMEIHPEIYLYPKLDQAFFLDDELRARKTWLDGQVKTEDWNHKHSTIQYQKLFEEASDQVKAIGEKSADYFFWTPSMERIFNFYPDMKLILTFRHPVERAWSHYWNEIGKEREVYSFEEAIAKEKERIKKSDYAKVHLSYVERGKYINSLKNLLSKINPDNIHIVVLDQLISDPENELKRIYKYLNVNDQLGLERAGVRFNHNWTSVPYPFWNKSPFLKKVESIINKLIKRIVAKAYPDIYERRRNAHKWEVLTRKPQKMIKMKPETRKHLLEIFEPYTIELEKLLNINLDAWKR